MICLRSALLASALFLAAPFVTSIASPAHAQTKKVSPEVGNALKEANKASTLAAAQAAIAKGKAAASSPEEKQAVSQMAAAVYTRLRSFNAAAEELELAGGTPAQLATLYYQARNFPKAIEFARKAGGTGQMAILIAQSHLQSNNLKEAAAAYERLARQGGPQAGSHWGQVASLRFKLKDQAGYQLALEQLIKIDPSSANWNILLSNLKNAQMPDNARLGLYLLMQETGNLKSVNDISDAAKLSMVTGAPNLAQGLLLAAINSGNTDPSLASLERTAAARITQVNADLARLSKSTASSDLLRAARAAFGLRQFDQSADLYRRALAAGADANEANFGIGIALARAGKTAAAREAFGKAQGAYKDVAQLWNLYTGTAGARAAAPAVSPPPAKK